MNKSNDLTLLNLSSEEPTVARNPAFEEENSIAESVELVLYETSKRQTWGQLIESMIISSFIFVFIFLIFAISIFTYATLKTADIFAAYENNAQEQQKNYELKKKKRLEEKAKYDEALIRGEKPVPPKPSGAFVSEESIEESAYQFGVAFGKFLAGATALVYFLVVVLLIIFLFLSYFFLPAIISLPFSIFLTWSWKKPYNILLLRPFSKKDTSTVLKKMVRNGLSGLGFFYTLADSQINQKWYVKYPILLGQLSLFQFRFRKIKNKRSVEKIRKLLNGKRRRIFNWSVSKNKIFALSCANDYWKPSVKELFSLADIIMIDLSGFRANVMWEVEECRRLNLLDRVVFLANQEDRETLAESLKNAEIDFVRNINFYGDNQVLDTQQILYQIAVKIPNVESSLSVNS
ncbi:MAG: hypothetical protein LUM44_07345 [Pyrinomonadaceae bacterium]|nr:hypothetical protein [Pyrinomonadaceae bacterium]